MTMLATWRLRVQGFRGRSFVRACVCVCVCVGWLVRGGFRGLFSRLYQNGIRTFAVGLRVFSARLCEDPRRNKVVGVYGLLSSWHR